MRALRSIRDFVADVGQVFVFRRKRKVLEEEMAAGYRTEAASPSLDVEWFAVEAEGL